MLGRRIFAWTFCAVVAAASAAYADEPAPAAPAAPAATPAAPTPAPTLAPTAEEKRRTVETAPAATSTPNVSYTITASPCSPCAPPAPACGPTGCFQRRDGCGCPTDECGNRYGRFFLGVEGGVSFFGSPDGILGEPIYVGEEQLDWDGLDYDPTVAARLTFAFHPDCRRCDSTVELRGTWYGSPSGDDSQEGYFGSRPGDDGLGDVSRPVVADYDVESDLWSVELNYWHEVSCSDRWRFDLGLGARWIQFNETAEVDFTTTGPGPFPVANGYAKSEVENMFLGAQLMAQAHYDVTYCVELYGSLKALFGSLQRDINVSDDSVFAGGRHSASNDDDEFVFGLNLELGAKWRIAKCFILSASYEMLFLDNVQRAEDAMDFSVSNSGAVQAAQNPDQLVVHTFWVGVTFNF